MTSNTVLALVPGSFCPASYYQPLVDYLSKRNVILHLIELQTVGKKPKAITMYDDAAHINAEVTKLSEQGKDIVLIAHSYGGVPTSQSIEGVSKKVRQAAGKKGGVVRVAYMTAVVPEVGMTVAEMMKDAPSGYTSIDEDGWMYHQDPATTAKYVFNDLSPEDGIKNVKMFDQHSAVSFANELTYAGYKDVPASYLFCENDLCVIPSLQQKGIEHIEKASGKKVDVTRIPSDHVPNAEAGSKHFLSVVEWLAGLAAKGGAAN